MPMILNGTGDITGLASVNSSVSAAEIGYLDGVTSALQTQFAGKADTTGNGAWTTYTPGALNITVGNGTLTGKYLRIGKLVSYRAAFTLGSTSAIASDASIAPPSTASGNYVGSAYYIDASTSNYYIGFTKNNYLGYQGVFGYVAAAVPFTWATGDVIYVSAVYEEA